MGPKKPEVAEGYDFAENQRFSSPKLLAAFHTSGYQ